MCVCMYVCVLSLLVTSASDCFDSIGVKSLSASITITAGRFTANLITPHRTPWWARARPPSFPPTPPFIHSHVHATPLSSRVGKRQKLGEAGDLIQRRGGRWCQILHRRSRAAAAALIVYDLKGHRGSRDERGRGQMWACRLGAITPTELRMLMLLHF